MTYVDPYPGMNGSQRVTKTSVPACILKVQREGRTAAH